MSSIKIGRKAPTPESSADSTTPGAASGAKPGLATTHAAPHMSRPNRPKTATGRSSGLQARAPRSLSGLQRKASPHFSPASATGVNRLPAETAHRVAGGAAEAQPWAQAHPFQQYQQYHQDPHYQQQHQDPHYQQLQQDPHYQQLQQDSHYQQLQHYAYQEYHHDPYHYQQTYQQQYPGHQGQHQPIPKAAKYGTETSAFPPEHKMAADRRSDSVRGPLRAWEVPHTEEVNPHGHVPKRDTPVAYNSGSSSDWPRHRSPAIQHADAWGQAAGGFGAPTSADAPRSGDPGRAWPASLDPAASSAWSARSGSAMADQPRGHAPEQFKEYEPEAAGGWQDTTRYASHTHEYGQAELGGGSAAEARRGGETNASHSHWPRGSHSDPEGGGSGMYEASSSGHGGHDTYGAWGAGSAADMSAYTGHTAVSAWGSEQRYDGGSHAWAAQGQSAAYGQQQEPQTSPANAAAYATGEYAAKVQPQKASSSAGLLWARPDPAFSS